MSQATPSVDVAPLAGVFARLARLRWQVAVWLSIDGLARLLWLVIAMAGTDLALDWGFRLDRAQRALVLAMALTAIGYAAYRWLLVPLSRPLDDERLAFEVERVRPGLRQALITAVQLAKQNGSGRQGASRALANRAIVEGARLAEGVRFDAVLDGRAGRRNLVALGAAAVVTAMAVGIAAAPMQTWLARNVLLREVKWPQRTYLVIEDAGRDNRLVFPRGGDRTLHVVVRDDSQEKPRDVYLEIEAAGQTTRRQLESVDEDRFRTTFARVSEPFRVRARGGDDLTEWVQVELVEPPALTTLELFSLLPRYAGGSRKPLAAGAGPYALLPGSELAGQALASKPLTRATLIANGRLLLEPQGTDQTASWPLTKVAVEELSLQVPAHELRAGEYHLELVDKHGFREREPIRFTLHRREDDAPRVDARLPLTRGMVTAEAQLPFECSVRDDFGLTGIDAVIRWQTPGEADGGEKTLSLDAQAADALVRVGEQAATGALNVHASLDLSSLSVSAGASLQIRFEARDNNDVSGPSTGRSTEFLLRIVTREELLTELLRRERELRQQFEQLVKQQEALVVESRALAAGLTNKQVQLAAARQSLTALYARQQELNRGAGQIADRFAQIAQEVQNNRLEEDPGNLQTRLLHEIVQPLRRVIENALETALAELDQARWADAAGDLNAALADAARQQDEGAAAMQAILQHMLRSETFQEAVNLLYELERAQADVNEQTRRAREERIRRLLEQNR